MSQYEIISENEFQRRCSDFVCGEVYYNLSCLADELFGKEYFNYEDVINLELYVFTDPNGKYYSLKYEEYKEYKIEIEEYVDNLNEFINDKDEESKEYKLHETWNNYLYELEDSPNIEYEEVFEWWLCSNWLIDKLKNYEEVIYEGDYITLWGRTCSNQAIMMDNVIRNIVSNIYKIKSSEEYEL